MKAIILFFALFATYLVIKGWVSIWITKESSNFYDRAITISALIACTCWTLFYYLS